MRIWLPTAAARAPTRDELAGRYALQGGVDGGQHDLRLVAPGLEGGERRHTARDDRGMRRDAVVGQAVPGRKLEDLDPGREETRGPRDLLQALTVARDKGNARVGRGKVGENLADERVRHRGERHRCLAGKGARQRRLEDFRGGRHYAPLMVECVDAPEYG